MVWIEDLSQRIGSVYQNKVEKYYILLASVIRKVGVVASWSGKGRENAEYWFIVRTFEIILFLKYEGWNFNSGNYLFTTDTK